MPTPATSTQRRKPFRRGWLPPLLAFAAAASLALGWVVVRGAGRAALGGERPAEPIANLHIRVLADSRPVPEARVRVRGDQGLDCAGVTNPSGDAELTECPPGPVSVRVDAPGFARIARAVTLSVGDNSLDVSVSSGSRLTGRVLDDQGQPLSGAEITLELASGVDDAEIGSAAEAGEDEAAPPDPDALWHATTATDGTFELDTLPAARFAVQARLAPYESVTLPDIAIPAAEPLAIVLQRMAAVAGRVLGPDQQPLAAASIRLAGSGVWPPRAVESDGRGEFRFAAVPPGVYELRGERAELVSAPLAGITVEAGEEVRIELSLGQGRSLRGSVHEATTGRPLAGAQIAVSEDTLGGAPKQVASGADGRFLLHGLRLLEHVVRIELPGYVAIETRWGPADSPLRVGLLRAARVQGRVEDDRGRPLADVELEIVGTSATGSRLRLHNAAPLTAAGGDATNLRASSAPALGALSLDNLGVTQGAVPPIPLVPGAGVGPALGASPGYRTAANGEFALEGIPPGEFRVIARKPGFVASGSDAFRLAPGGVREDLVLALGRGGSIAGRVLDGRRRPVGGVRLSLNAGSEPLRWTSSEEDGSFEFAAVLGRGSLIAQPEHGAAKQIEVEVRAGETQRLDVVLESSRAVLRGRVIDGHGAPIPGARVKIETRSSRAQVSTTALTANDGTFELDGLPDPPYSLRAEHVDYAPGPWVSVSSPDEDVELVLDAGESLAGIVLDATTRVALSSARVTLESAGQSERVQTDAEGRFRFQRVAPGDYVLAAQAPGHVTVRRTVRFRGDARRGVLPDAELVLEAAGTLSGEVVDRLGVPVWNAEVTAGDPPSWQQSVRTDHAGRFVLDGLAPGDTHVSARKSGVSEARVEARVHEGVDSPGLILRFAEVVREAEVEPPEPATGATSTSGPAHPSSEADTTPLRLSRQGDRVIVERVGDGSAAERIGLRHGDVLVAINGEPVRSPAQARGMLGLPGPRGWLIEVWRGGAKLQMRYP